MEETDQGTYLSSALAVTSPSDCVIIIELEPRAPNVTHRASIFYYQFDYSDRLYVLATWCRRSCDSTDDALGGVDAEPSS
jgi:hypothetical protein